MRKLFFPAALLVCLLAAIGSNAQQASPFLGTWKMNLAKSQLNGAAPRSRVERYEASGKDGIKFTSESVDAEGKKSTMGYVAQFDGKDYPMTGSPRTDATALERHNAYAFTSITKKDGKVADHIRRYVTKDGKTLIMASGGGLWFFDKQ